METRILESVFVLGWRTLNLGDNVHLSEALRCMAATNYLWASKKLEALMHMKGASSLASSLQPTHTLTPPHRFR